MHGPRSLAVRTGVRVTRVGRQGRRYVVEAGDRRFEAADAVIAVSTFQHPVVPPFAGEDSVPEAAVN